MHPSGFRRWSRDQAAKPKQKNAVSEAASAERFMVLFPLLRFMTCFPCCVMARLKRVACIASDPDVMGTKSLLRTTPRPPNSRDGRSIRRFLTPACDPAAPLHRREARLSRLGG